MRRATAQRLLLAITAAAALSLAAALFPPLAAQPADAAGPTPALILAGGSGAPRLPVIIAAIVGPLLFLLAAAFLFPNRKTPL
jgi:hypothetical protein